MCGCCSLGATLGRASRLDCAEAVMHPTTELVVPAMAAHAGAKRDSRHCRHSNAHDGLRPRRKCTEVPFRECRSRLPTPRLIQAGVVPPLLLLLLSSCPRRGAPEAARNSCTEPVRVFPAVLCFGGPAFERVLRLRTRRARRCDADRPRRLVEVDCREFGSRQRDLPPKARWHP